VWSGLRAAYIKITIGVIHNVLNYGANFYIMYLKGAQIPRQEKVATKLSTVTSNVCWSSVRNLLFLTILAPRIMRRLSDFWKSCALLMYINYKCDGGAYHTSRRPADWHNYNGSGRGRSPNRCSVSGFNICYRKCPQIKWFQKSNMIARTIRIGASFVAKYLGTIIFVSLLKWVNISWRLLVSKV
jgi:hypothetical protein